MFRKTVTGFLIIFLMVSVSAVSFADVTDSFDSEASGSISEEEQQGSVRQESLGQSEKPILNTEDHIVYMSGDSKGLFRPKDKITRAETAEIIWSLVKNKDKIVLSGINQFSDVPENAWYREAVNDLAELGILNGYSGEFKPENTVTRAEFITILSRFFEKAESEIDFKDISETHWAADAVKTALANGWISGYSDGTFKPAAGMTRTEAAVVINRALGRSGDEATIRASVNDGIKFFPDVDYNYWGYIDIIEASNNHKPDIDDQGRETWVLFTREKSNLTPGMHRINGKLYYVDEKTGDFVCNREVEGHYFGENRCYTTGNKELDERLAAITSEYLTDGTPQASQLYKLFEHVIDSYDYRAGSIIEPTQTGWEEQCALEMLRNGKGNCYRYAALYYYLAKEAGYNPKAISGFVDRSMRPHGWVEIVGDDGQERIYDTVFSRSRRTIIFGRTYEEAPYIYTKTTN